MCQNCLVFFLVLYQWFINSVAHDLEVSTYRLICVCYVFSVDSAEMLVNLDIPWVILGHSERRQLLNETNEVQTFLLSLGIFLKFPFVLAVYDFYFAKFKFY